MTLIFISNHRWAGEPLAIEGFNQTCGLGQNRPAA
jgi:hypothetical protein